ncbi:DUF2752 domain-containing protein [Geothrix edaphica]|uniref:DUF2752 domain-containing protein n=1 Tax=Geothrix edaphica TaxID=2927976 RepID=A0ABQ5Q2A2_9BACT|nr:DUF2752 domain-containing protein [Geothrix edaphica]GLH68426.1 hypothetical protein GETHED_27900 [Geothrix edaphica]
MRRVPWIALGGLALAGAAGLAGLLAPFSGWLPGCAFKRVTGFACATCGLTRSLLALGQGRWREALHWYPALGLLAVALPVAALWDLRRAWRGAPYPALPASRALRLGAWLLLAGIWALQVLRGI